jgi:hypothetical protein
MMKRNAVILCLLSFLMLQGCMRARPNFSGLRGRETLKRRTGMPLTISSPRDSGRAR